LLFVYLQGHRGSSRSSPSECPRCRSRYYLNPEFVDASGKSLSPASIMRIEMIE
jgi:hypothetical protein